MRKRKGTSGPPAPAKRTQTSSPNLSSLDSESFFKGLQQNDSNPLHSTALEDHEDVQAEGQLRRNPREREESRGGKNQGAAANRKPAGGGGGEEEQRRKSRTETGGKGRRVSLSSGAAQRRQQEDEGARESADEEVTESEESDPVGARKNSRALLSSDDQSPEGSIWGPSPKRTRRLLLGRKPKGRSAAASKGAGDGGRKEGRRAGGAVTQLEVVLDAVLDFCQQYRETVESAAVRGAIDLFSDSVRARLLEKISSFKDLRSIKRDNTKVGSLIEAKRLRLLNSKQELMRAERQVMLLQKEKAELQQRLADLRRGQALLHDIRELTARHLRQRRKQPATKETYGASSLAALLLEAKLPQRHSHPPRRVTGRSKKSAPK